MHTLTSQALMFATAAHQAVGQRRNYTGEPYIRHPEFVAETVSRCPGSTDEMIAAAWLHDVVEDTQVTFADLADFFPDEVVELVQWLTDVSVSEDGNREKRKAIDREHLALAPAAAQTIKLADLLDNCATITDHDPHFAKVYMREKRELLKVLKLGDPFLYQTAQTLVENYFAEHPDA